MSNSITMGLFSSKLLYRWHVPDRGLDRRFEIASYDGCPGDNGWLTVCDTLQTRGCSWEREFDTFPRFFYSEDGDVTLSSGMAMKRHIFNICYL